MRGRWLWPVSKSAFRSGTVYSGALGADLCEVLSYGDSEKVMVVVES